MNSGYRIPTSGGKFVHTNPQTIMQRVGLLKTYFPGIRSVAELCCGNCFEQWRIYHEMLNVQQFMGLDIDPAVVALNTRQNVPCLQGDVMQPATLARFREFDAIFFGPPLSVDCTGHKPLAYKQVIPAYDGFMELLLKELRYTGLVVCICPKTTRMNEVEKLHAVVRAADREYGLSLIHRSHSNLTSAGKATELRLKYVELWFSRTLGDRWQMLEGLP
jgi:hypothetical protein